MDEAQPANPNEWKGDVCKLSPASKRETAARQRLSPNELGWRCYCSSGKHKYGLTFQWIGTYSRPRTYGLGEAVLAQHCPNILKMEPGVGSSEQLSSNNPFRTAQPPTAQQSSQGEKEVASAEILSGPDNAPSPVETRHSAHASPVATREADKEVTGSWQMQSQGQSAPIPMAYHESNPTNRGEQFYNDVKGPPPAYHSLAAANSSGPAAGLAPLTTPSSLEPESPEVSQPLRPEDKSAVGQLLAWIPPAPRSFPQSSRHVQPVVIPQLDVPPQGESVPFQRCYSDTLAGHGVSIQDFTRFLDGLEVAQLPNSTLQGVRMFGAGVSMVPIPILATLTGKGISALAGSGSGHSGSRARLYMDQARERYFKPRGLRVTIVKDDELNPRLQIPAHAPRLGALTQSTLSANSCQRRVEALSPYAAPLRFDVPEQDKQIQGVQKMARKHLVSRFKEKAQWTDDLRKRQWALAASEAGNWQERYRGKLDEIRDTQYQLIREAGQSDSRGNGSLCQELWEHLTGLQRELQLIISERQSQFMDHTAVAAEMEEVTWTRRLKWLVIESLQ